MSRVSQTLGHPTLGSQHAIEQIAGYLLSTPDFDLVGRVNPGCNEIVAMCDSSHHGDGGLTTKDQTGVVICLNGVPVHWRSNRQTKTTLSPVESEVYALSVGVKDTRLMGCVLEECGVPVSWPMEVHSDSQGAISFKNDTCPTSKVRGCVDYREAWVEELKAEGTISVAHVSDRDNIADVFTKSYRTYKYRERVAQLRAAGSSAFAPLRHEGLARGTSGLAG